MSDSICQFRIDADDKSSAFAVIESYGMTPSQVLRSFLKEIGETKRIPLSFDYQASNHQPNKDNDTPEVDLLKADNSNNGDVYDYIMSLPPADYTQDGMSIQKQLRDEWY